MDKKPSGRQALEDLEQLELRSVEADLKARNANGAMARGLIVKQDFCRWYQAERDNDTNPGDVMSAAARLLAYCIAHAAANCTQKDMSIVPAATFFMEEVIDSVMNILADQKINLIVLNEKEPKS